LNSPEYHTSKIERRLLAKNRREIGKFIGSREVNFLGAGDGRKIESFVRRKNKITIFDLSPEMINFCRQTLRRPVTFTQTDFEKIDFQNGANQLWVMLGNTLGNFDDIPQFLRKISATKSKLILGMELLDDAGGQSNHQETIAKIVQEYNNETGFDFIFTPLELLGVKRDDGKIQVRFNQKTKRIEEFFAFTNVLSRKKFAQENNLQLGEVRKILLSVSSKRTQQEFIALVKASGFEVRHVFQDGTNFIFLLES